MTKMTVNHYNHVPILRSILSPEALVPHLEAAFGLTISRIQLIKAVILDTYRVWTSKGLYILRIYPSQRRTFDEINAELEFVSFLHSQGVSVSVPVLHHDGKRLLTLQAPEGQRYAVLFTYAQGHPLDQNLDTIRIYGNTLACMHTIADALPLTLARTALDLAFLLDRPLAHLESFKHRRNDWEFLHQVAHLLRPRIAALPTEAPCYGYCHGDASGGNAHVTASGQVTLFDFDFCGLGWRAYDLGTFLNGEPAEVAHAFLEGYQTVRMLTNEEQDVIPLFQIAQSIWMLGTRASYINEWGDIYFTDNFIDRVLHQIRTTFEVYQR